MTIDKATILAVDDRSENLMALGALMGDEFDIQMASSAREALSLLEATRPDLILIDVMMPDMNGLELCQIILARPALCDIPVIFLTADHDPDTEARGLLLGAVDFIKKPFEARLTRRRILNHLERERLRRQVGRHAEQLAWQVRERTCSLQIAKEAAESANRLKEAILRNMSHEFRTPLNGVLMMHHLLGKLTLGNAKASEYLDKATTSARRLNTMLSNFIDLSDAAAGNLTLNETPFALADLLDSLRTLDPGAAASAAGKGLQVTVTPLPAEIADLRLHGDWNHIRQILLELIDNAVKYSEHGEIVVRAAATPRPDGTVDLCLEVSDQGMGIAPADQARIFTAFLQLDDSTKRRHGGNGIGLALSKMLAQAMKGDLTVHSQSGAGSTFRLALRLKPADPAVQRQANG